MRKRKERGYYRQLQGNPVFFEIRLLDGGLEIVQKDHLRDFMATNKQKVCSYAPYSL